MWFSKRSALLCACLWSWAIPTRAAFEDAFYGARSAAMGGAMTAIPDDSASIFYNPATLGQIRTPDVDANYFNEKESPAGTATKQIADGTAILPASGKLHGTFGLAGLYDKNDSLSNAGKQIKIGYGSRGFFDTGTGTLDLGGSLDYLNESFGSGGTAVTHAAADIGALYRFDDRYALGVSGINLGGPHFNGPNGIIDQAPTTLRVGFSESVSGYTVGLDAVHSGSTGPIPALNYAALGMERWLATAQYGSIAARTGLNLGNQEKTLSGGIGWKIMGAEIDYAVIAPLSGPADLSNAISMTFRFGVSDPQAEFERILKEEMGDRKKLSLALEAGEVHQWRLNQELSDLKSQLDTLKAQLVDKTLSAQEAEKKLQDLDDRYHAAMGKFEKITSERAKAAKATDQDRFQKDWAAYQKLKAEGAPNALLIRDIKELLRDYKDKKQVDLAPANRELIRLLGQ